MTPELLKYLCEPITKAELKLVDVKTDADNNIISGNLVTKAGEFYPIINGIPRFVEFVSEKTVESFGNEWNHFNFIDFKVNWLNHTVKNTFGSVDAFKGKIIIDAGGGSGSQSKWFSEFGASHVIMMDLSHSVDDVVKRNLVGIKNVDVIQCSIDAPPIRDNSINGIVYCHNVIQHTPSVEKTAHALWALTSAGGEFVFNCYPLNDKGLVRWLRFHLIYQPLRSILSRMPFMIIKEYARFMSLLRLIPFIGLLLEKSGFCVRGDVPFISKESTWNSIKRKFKATYLNTFDCFGSHEFQHLKTDDEIKALVNELQPDLSKVKNIKEYFSRPAPIGCALRLFR